MLVFKERGKYMTTLVEYKTLSNEKLFSVSEKLLVENLSVQDLINQSIDSEREDINTTLKRELILRGRDDIQSRITIKKTFKNLINDLEFVLKTLDNDDAVNKATVKLQKKKFLNMISLFDRLQLEWQKYDLALKR